MKTSHTKIYQNTTVLSTARAKKSCAAPNPALKTGGSCRGSKANEEIEIHQEPITTETG